MQIYVDANPQPCIYMQSTVLWYFSGFCCSLSKLSLWTGWDISVSFYFHIPPSALVAEKKTVEPIFKVPLFPSRGRQMGQNRLYRNWRQMLRMELFVAHATCFKFQELLYSRSKYFFPSKRAGLLRNNFERIVKESKKYRLIPPPVKYGVRSPRFTWTPCGAQHSCTVFIGWNPATPPPHPSSLILAHCSAKIDEISLRPLNTTLALCWNF
jgi:hypothetical protein